MNDPSLVQQQMCATCRGYPVGHSECDGSEWSQTFPTLPAAMWFILTTVTTVGYGDVYPITPLGRMAASIIAVAGIGVVALPAGVFASSFSDIIREKSEKKAEERAKKTAMGLEDE